MYPCFNMVLMFFSDGKQFNGITKVTCKPDICRTDVPNAFHMDIIKIDFHSMGQGTQNGKFMCRIISVHIQGWFSFGKPQLLSPF